MSSDGKGHIVINCQECNRTCIKVEVGTAIFTGIGCSVRCAGCEAYLFRQRRV